MARIQGRLLALTVGGVLLLAACGSSSSAKSGAAATTTSAPAATTAPAATAAPTTAAPKSAGADVSVTATKLGLTLVDSSGLTLYQYMPDPKGSSTCTGQCATMWPPLTVSGTTVTLGSKLPQALFSTIAGANGTHIVAVSGHALYRFSGDAKPGDTNGEGIGGVWHAAGPVGNTM